MAGSPSPAALYKRVWDGRVPIEIALSPSECRTYDKSDHYFVLTPAHTVSIHAHFGQRTVADLQWQISYPRVSYLPFLLPKLLAFFSSSLIDPDSQPRNGWFSFEGVPLKWHYPVGLLFDLYSGAEPVTSSSTGDEHYTHSSQSHHEGDIASQSDQEPREILPWRLTVHFSDWPDQELVRLDADGRVMHDAFINSVKEADFLRNGTAKGIMTLSKDDSSGLYQAVQDHDFPKYQRIYNILLTSVEHQFRNIPLRIFLPSPPDSQNPTLKAVQSPCPPTIPATSTSSGMSPRPTQVQIQTIGSALNSLLPSLFPSKRTPVLAKAVLHGAVIPLTAPVEEVVRSAAYADGWLSIVVSMVI
ncbi:hypothetical protein AJ80_01217 [Polytolypa hystricis UAMH7299]|uniref:Autophagy protein 5 n=1 Tax=Polytolypa hystricis (strain UAMH7299) TaxID=1447883 RepID=A0A2B7Z1S6_POLH7|nr:hypothetical protein AJ80_01217 [Polytolypa hystricis UAMH7299]